MNNIKSLLKSNILIVTLIYLSNVLMVSGQELTNRLPEPLKVDLRYAPKWWQSTICLPDDPLKTIVGKEGDVYYDYIRTWGKDFLPGPFREFNTKIEIQIPKDIEWQSQQLLSSKVPIIQSAYEGEKLKVLQEVFAVAPPFIARVDSSELNYLGLKLEKKEIKGAPRNDVIIVHYKNLSNEELEIAPAICVQSTETISCNEKTNTITIGKNLQLTATTEINKSLQSTITMDVRNKNVPVNKLDIQFKSIKIAPNSECLMALGISIGENALLCPKKIDEALFLKRRSIKYWQNLELPYNKIVVPDTAIQSLLISSIRNIYQAREIRNNLPAYQVGPTCYRGLWVVDGSFLLEAMTFLGQIDDVKNGIDYLLSFQQENGSFMLIDGHWKETGIVLWALTRYSKLTGNKKWLEKTWPKLESAFNYLTKMREMTVAQPDAPNFNLIPEGFSDGGLGGGKHYEYTNIYWNLIGMKAAVQAAQWLGKTELANKWEKEYDDFYDTFHKAAERDIKKDKFGNKYLPIRMTENDGVLPQKAQWAFLHAVFPGKLFHNNDEIVTGNLKMLKAVEKEGMVYNTGWHNNGIWNYFGSFYGHALLWLGEGQDAAEKLYAMANHASPTLVWREEQSIQEAEKFSEIGDMPHNWASAEFVRLVRHLLVLERGTELHLFEGIPKKWTEPGKITKLKDIYTEFGIISLALKISEEGAVAHLDVNLNPTNHVLPTAIIVHLENITGKEEVLKITGKTSIKQKIKIK